MSHRVPEAVWQALTCAHCVSPVLRTADGARCAACEVEYPATADGALDLRLKRSKTVVADFELGMPLVPPGFAFEPLPMNPHAEVEFRREQIPSDLTAELLSYVPRARSKDSLVLDLGCGAGVHRAICEAAGFAWVGLDYNLPQANILGDGHALPFASDTFEFVLSCAVMEHIRYPFLVAREAFRVLKPGGLFIGTVAFLEPFHGDSYYHHTHLGMYNTLHYAGFDIERLGPSPTWSSLTAQVSMAGLFPKLPRPIGRSLVWPIEALHKLWWRLGRLVSDEATETQRLLTNTGAHEFVARKPGAAAAS